jgi:chemotaxis signal transduction protein
MSVGALENAASESFVLLQIAGQRFALPAGIIAELAPPVRLHAFPHTSPLLTGVIVRRGRIVPVFDAGRALSGKSSLGHRFYLIARHQFADVAELGAIPVDGECELVSSPERPPSENQPSYVSGEVTAEGDTVGVLDLQELIRLHTAAAHGASSPESPA